MGARGAAEGPLAALLRMITSLSPTHGFAPCAAFGQGKGGSAWVACRGCKAAELWMPAEPVLPGEGCTAALGEGRQQAESKAAPGEGSAGAGGAWPELSLGREPLPVRGDLLWGGRSTWERGAGSDVVPSGVLSPSAGTRLPASARVSVAKQLLLRSYAALRRGTRYNQEMLTVPSAATNKRAFLEVYLERDIDTPDPGDTQERNPEPQITF